jgi:hypothetical protein
LVELLVVMGIMTLLAVLILPNIIHGIARAELTNCIAQLRQIGQVAMISYYKDYDSWMVSCGYRESPKAFNEPALDLAACAELDERYFPYWYESLAPYVNPAATRQNAVISYCKREGLRPDQVHYRQFKREIARLCMLFTCPAKKQSPLTYGYNYAAPFGESILYPRKKFAADYPYSDCNIQGHGLHTGNPMPQEFCWPYGTTPCYRCFPPFGGEGAAEPAPVPILWYGQSAHNSVITTPENQIAVCDTGLVTNSPDLKGKYADPRDWVEHGAGHSAINDTGYTRFPLSPEYTSYTKNMPVPSSYKYLYETYDPDPNGVRDITLNYAWRPVPRHNGKTACVFFDGGVRAIDIMDIVSYEWGDKRCLFDNRPSGKPPAPKFATPYGAVPNPLPKRKANGDLE